MPVFFRRPSVSPSVRGDHSGVKEEDILDILDILLQFKVIGHYRPRFGNEPARSRTASSMPFQVRGGSNGTLPTPSQ